MPTPGVNAPPRDGLCLELLLDGEARDGSGGNHHVDVLGATATIDRFGRPGHAYFFDGIDDHLTIAPPPVLDGTALTVSLWLRLDSGLTEGWSDCFICQDDGDDDDQSRRVFQLSMHSGRIVWHRMQNARDPATRRVSPRRWYHVAAVVSGDQHRLYLDGRLEASVTDSLRAHATQPIHIGRKGTDEHYFFVRGAMDDVRMYSRAMSAEEVRALAGDRGTIRRSRPRLPDPISGTWESTNGARLELTLADDGAVHGVVTSGGPRRFVTLEHGRFDRATGQLQLDGRARAGDEITLMPFVIRGALAGRRLSATYHFGDRQGVETFAKHTAAYRWRMNAQSLLHAVVRPFRRSLIPAARTLRALRRPSPGENRRALRARGESLESMVFRDATAADVPALAILHAKTWAATYPGVRHPPTAALRERQWREAFANADGSWFCIVIENTRGELVGFAKGVVHHNAVGDLNKIYLLSEYQRLGLGRRLVGVVAKRFLTTGVTTMTLSADAENPSCRFYLAVGAENTRDERGRVDHGGFVWRDLEALAARCT